MSEVLEVLRPIVVDIMKWTVAAVIATTIIHELFETTRAWISRTK